MTNFLLLAAVPAPFFGIALEDSSECVEVVSVMSAGPSQSVPLRACLQSIDGEAVTNALDAHTRLASKAVGATVVLKTKSGTEHSVRPFASSPTLIRAFCEERRSGDGFVTLTSVERGRARLEMRKGMTLGQLLRREGLTGVALVRLPASCGHDGPGASLFPAAESLVLVPGASIQVSDFNRDGGR